MEVQGDFKHWLLSPSQCFQGDITKGPNDPETNTDCSLRRVKQMLLTLREQIVLKQIREASARARTVKLTIRNVEDEPTREAAVQELENLRRLRTELERERLAAAEERMRILGHLD